MNVSEMFQKIVKESEKGFSILQGLMMVAAVGGGLYVFTLMNTQSKKSLSTVKQVSDISDLNINLTNNVASLLLDTRQTNGIRTGGICEFVRVNTVNSPLANIYMNLPDFDEPLFSDDRWSSKFEGYVIVETSKCDKYIYQEFGMQVPVDGYRKCFKIDPTSDAFGVGISRNLADKYNPYIEVKINPVYTNPIEDSPFVQFTPNKADDLDSIEGDSQSNEPIKYDSKSVGWNYEIITSYVRSVSIIQNEEVGELADEKRRMRRLKGFTWSGDVGSCDLVVGDKIKELALAGTGPGSTDNDIIQNFAGFTENSKANQGDDPIDVAMVSTQVQAGKLVGTNGRTITSDDDSFVYASCNERSFKCQQASGVDDKRVYDAIDLYMNLTYQRKNKISSSMRNMSFSPTITFRRSSGTLELAPRNYEDQDDNSTSAPEKNFRFITNFDKDPYEKFEDGKFYKVFFRSVPKTEVFQLAQITTNDVRSAIDANFSADNDASAILRRDPALVFGSNEQAIAIPRPIDDSVNDPDAITVSGRKYRLLYFVKEKVEIELKASSKHELMMKLMDLNASESDPTANDTCRDICNASNQYNTGSDPLHPVFEYKANVVRTIDDDGNEIQTYYQTVQQPVACTSCYMKNCSRFGLGTFGPMDKMPTEPADAGLPECVLHESVASSKTEKANIGLGVANANKCLALKLKSGDMAGYEYIPADCSESKKVMCFSYGKHQLASDFIGTSKTLIDAPFSQGRNICFNTSKEMFNTESLTGLFDQQGFDIANANPDNVPTNIKPLADEAKAFMAIGTVTTAPTLLQDFRIINSGSTLQGPIRRVLPALADGTTVVPGTTIELAEVGFFNLANQGSFLAPIGGNQEEALREYNDKVNQIGSNEFWVGLKTDNMGFLYAPAPLIPEQALNDSNKWSLAFNKDSLLVAQKHDVELDLNTGSGAQVGLLYHHVRYKGVAFANEEKPITEEVDDDEVAVNLRYICLDKSTGEVQISQARGHKASEGYQICENEDEDYIFFPPTTTAGWIKALHLVHSNDPNAAFPVYNVESAKDYDPAFVAVKSDGGEPVFYSANTAMFDDFLEDTVTWRVDHKGKFIQNGNAPINYHFCLNDETGEVISQESACSGSKRYFSADELALIKDNKNMIVKKNFLLALKNIGSGKKIQVSEEPEE